MKLTLKILAISVLTVAAVFNAQPILELTRQLIMTITNVPFAWLLNGVGLSFLTSLIGRILIDIVGIAFWALIQICELLPGILKGELSVIQLLIRAFSRFKEEVINGNDSEVVATLKKSHNAIPKKWLQTANTFKFIAYAIEICLACLRFPVYQGGMTAAIAAFPFGYSLSSVLFGNLLYALSTIFAFEVIVWFLSWMIKGQAVFGFGSKKTQKHQNGVPDGY